MGQDLNRLSAPQAATGDYGVNQPDNAWPGAADDVVISMRQIGGYLYQTGYDKDGDGTFIMMRRKPVDTGADAWDAWTKFPADPEPPEPEVPEE